MFQYDGVTVHKEMVHDELELNCEAGFIAYYHPVSVLDLSNALVAEWERIPAVRFQGLGGSFPRRVEAALD